MKAKMGTWLPREIHRCAKAGTLLDPPTKPGAPAHDVRGTRQLLEAYAQQPALLEPQALA
jgi:hypothetical protein